MKERIYICNQELMVTKGEEKRKNIKKLIAKTIKELNLKEEEILHITYGNMEKICEIANVKMIDLMYYLRYER